MWRLKATKTSLYGLVAKYEKLPPMRRASFIKFLRVPDYLLQWTDGDGLLCEAFFAATVGRPLLSITKKELGGPTVESQVYSLEVAELWRMGMMEEFMTAEEKRSAKCGN